MTILERARRLTEATEQHQLAAEAWSKTPADASDHLRVSRAIELSERAVKYTQALQALQALAKGGDK